jgi:hypothetical protein
MNAVRELGPISTRRASRPAEQPLPSGGEALLTTAREMTSRKEVAAGKPDGASTE